MVVKRRCQNPLAWPAKIDGLVDRNPLTAGETLKVKVFLKAIFKKAVLTGFDDRLNSYMGIGFARKPFYGR